MKYSFARANAYSSGYRPRSYTPGRYAHFCPGELISGYVEATFSPYLSANFIAWDRLDIEWAKTFRSWYLPGPWQIVLKPETVAKIPLLGGENLYAPQNPLIANSARLGTPELDLYTWRLRAKVAHTPRHSRHLWSANNTLIKENIPENEEAPKEKSRSSAHRPRHAHDKPPQWCGGRNERSSKHTQRRPLAGKDFRITFCYLN